MTTSRSSVASHNQDLAWSRRSPRGEVIGARCAHRSHPRVATSVAAGMWRRVCRAPSSPTRYLSAVLHPCSRGTVVVAFALLALVMSPLAKAGWFAGNPPNDIGVRDGRLKPCPDTPNCVNSKDAGGSAIVPIEYRGATDIAWRRLITIVSSLPRTRIVRKDENYLRAEVSSRVFGFVDDIEFLLDPNAAVIHVRSASRVGHSDLGVNRKRVEQIRVLFAREKAPSG